MLGCSALVTEIVSPSQLIPSGVQRIWTSFTAGCLSAKMFVSVAMNGLPPCATTRGGVSTTHTKRAHTKRDKTKAGRSKKFGRMRKKKSTFAEPQFSTLVDSRV